MRILLIEDDSHLNDTLCLCLRREGYETDGIQDGEEGLMLALHAPYDLMIIDRRLPILDGMSILKAVREKQISTPVILLTAQSGLQDRIDGLDQGADDYISKPFEIGELLARIRALMRRPPNLCRAEVLSHGNTTLDISRLELSNPQKGLACSLTPTENEMMAFFMKYAGQSLARDRILNYVWGMDADIDTGNLDNYVYFLRKRLRSIQSEYRIRTLKGKGFILEHDHDTKNT